MAEQTRATPSAARRRPGRRRHRRRERDRAVRGARAVRRGRGRPHGRPVRRAHRRRRPRGVHRLRVHRRARHRRRRPAHGTARARHPRRGPRDRRPAPARRARAPGVPRHPARPPVHGPAPGDLGPGRRARLRPPVPVREGRRLHRSRTSTSWCRSPRRPGRPSRTRTCTPTRSGASTGSRPVRTSRRPCWRASTTTARSNASSRPPWTPTRRTPPRSRCPGWAASWSSRSRSAASATSSWALPCRAGSRAWRVVEEGTGLITASLARARTVATPAHAVVRPRPLRPRAGARRRRGGAHPAAQVGAPPFEPSDLTTAASFAAQAALANQLAAGRHAQDLAALLDERERIARDLHDLAIQQLFATGLQLETVRRRAARGVDATELTAILDEALDNVDGSVRQIRRIVHDLRDPDAATGLVERLRREASLARTGLGFAPSLIVTLDGVDRRRGRSRRGPSERACRSGPHVRRGRRRARRAGQRRPARAGVVRDRARARRRCGTAGLGPGRGRGRRRGTPDGRTAAARGPATSRNAPTSTVAPSRSAPGRRTRHAPDLGSAPGLTLSRPARPASPRAPATPPTPRPGCGAADPSSRAPR